MNKNIILALTEKEYSLLQDILSVYIHEDLCVDNDEKKEANSLYSEIIFDVCECPSSGDIETEEATSMILELAEDHSENKSLTKIASYLANSLKID